MLTAQLTPNCAGVALLGDFNDFDSLYEALYTVIGGEGDYGDYETARFRVLALCYDLRHANMGDRDVRMVANGLDPETMKRLGRIGHEHNAYFEIQLFLPEALFLLVALNEFAQLYAVRQSKQHGSMAFTARKTIWDGALVHVRMLQAAMWDCICEALPQSSRARVQNLLLADNLLLEGYATQYLDVLNIRFLHMDPDKRRKSLSLMAKRVAEDGDEYQKVARGVREAAREHNCREIDIGISDEYPEDVDW